MRTSKTSRLQCSRVQATFNFDIDSGDTSAYEGSFDVSLGAHICCDWSYCVSHHVRQCVLQLEAVLFIIGSTRFVLSAVLLSFSSHRA